MFIHDLHQSQHAMLDTNQLVPLIQMDEKTQKELQLKLSRKEIQRICEKLHIASDTLQYDPSSIMSPICYWDGLFYFTFPSLQEDFLFAEPSPDGFDPSYSRAFFAQKERFYQYIRNEEWAKAIQDADKKTSFIVFMKLKHKLPDDMIKPLFLQVYQRNEYGFDTLDMSSTLDILHRDTPDMYSLSQASHVEYADAQQQQIIVYRGAADKSTPLDKALSWTLERDTAAFFATRFNNKGIIYQATVDKNHVLAYMNEREEAEVLIEPKHLHIISTIPVESTTT